MTTASEPVIIEGETAGTAESNEIVTEETPEFRDEQEEEHLQHKIQYQLRWGVIGKV